MSDRDIWRSGFWDGLGLAAVVFAACLGCGCCSLLGSLGDARVEAAKSKALVPSTAQTPKAASGMNAK